MKNILVINLGYIGDVICSSPVCIELKKQYPDARIIYVTCETSVETASCLPGVDKVFVFNRYNEHKGLKVFNLAFNLWKEKLDAAVILNENIRSAFFAFASGAKIRVGRNHEGRGFLLTHKIPYTEEEKQGKIHITEHYMRLLKPLGLYNPDYTMGLEFRSDDNAYVERIIEESGCKGHNLIGFCPFSARDFKDWKAFEAKKFVEIINNTTDNRLMIVGTDRAKEFCQQLRDSGINNFVDLSCKTNIPQLGAAISKCSAFVSVDSAPMHAALAVDVPTVGLFFQANHEKWAPKDLTKNRLILRYGDLPAEEVLENLNSICCSEKVRG